MYLGLYGWYQMALHPCPTGTGTYPPLPHSLRRGLKELILLSLDNLGFPGDLLVCFANFNKPFS